MEFRSVLAALALIAAAFVPAALERLPDAEPARCDDRQRIESIDPRRSRGALPVVRCVAEGAGPFRPPAGAAALLLGHRIDVDRATAEELRALPGIGPGRARRIVGEREARGPFGDVEGLRRVRGLGKRRVEALRDWVRASGVRYEEIDPPPR